MADSCNVCSKRIASFSHHLFCSFCNKSYHLKCLPGVSKSDSIYVNRNIERWLCIKCAEKELPFNNVDEDDSFYDASSKFLFDISKISLLSAHFMVVVS